MSEDWTGKREVGFKLGLAQADEWARGKKAVSLDLNLFGGLIYSLAAGTLQDRDKGEQEKEEKESKSQKGQKNSIVISF